MGVVLPSALRTKGIHSIKEQLPNVSLPHRCLHSSSPNYPLPPRGDLVFLSEGKCGPLPVHPLSPAHPPRGLAFIPALVIYFFRG